MASTSRDANCLAASDPIQFELARSVAIKTGGAPPHTWAGCWPGGRAKLVDCRMGGIVGPNRTCLRRLLPHSLLGVALSLPVYPGHKRGMGQKATPKDFAASPTDRHIKPRLEYASRYLARTSTVPAFLPVYSLLLHCPFRLHHRRPLALVRRHVTEPPTNKVVGVPSNSPTWEATADRHYSPPTMYTRASNGS